MILRFLSVLRFEMAKAFAAKATWITIALPTLLAIFTVLWGHGQQNLEAALAGEEQESFSAFFIFARSAGAGYVLGGIMLLLYSSMLFANEGSWKTYKTIMLSPHGRIEWLGGKFALLMLLVFAILVCVATAAGVLSAVLGDFTAIEEEGFVFLEASEMRGETYKALALALPPMIALAAFGLMFSTMTDHPGIAASATLGGYMILETAKESMDEQSVYLFNNFMPSLIDNSYFGVLRNFAQGYLDEPWEEHMLPFAIATPMISAAVFLLIAGFVFGRRDFLV